MEKRVEWTTKDLIEVLEEFVPIYETRPVKNNIYGMGFDQSFGPWFIARWLKLDLMIESGAFKDIQPGFCGFGSIDWGPVMKRHGITNLSRVLIFFYDHQNELKRLKQALKVGFRHLVFEDNYDTGTGDHYSLRQLCDQSFIRGEQERVEEPTGCTTIIQLSCTLIISEECKNELEETFIFHSFPFRRKIPSEKLVIVLYKLYRLERVTADLCQKEPSIFYLRVTKNTSNMPVESISSYRFYELFLLINNSKSVYNWKLSFIYHIFSWEKK
ncbi:DNA-directed RNA polymerase subunit beta [Citrus sinensis]|nr:DNA-directed RNA polymerase subunit beta [Citrus sinensis]